MNMAITIPEKTCERVGVAVARKLFESRGNHSEIHLSEVEVATLVAMSIKLVFEKATITEVAR